MIDENLKCEDLYSFMKIVLRTCNLCVGRIVHPIAYCEIILQYAFGCYLLLPLPALWMGIKKKMAAPLRQTFTIERMIVSERMLSNAFHDVAFLVGFPSQTDLMTSIQRMSMAMVITFSKINYKKR